MMTSFVGFLADTLVWTGALIALVLVLRRPVARGFGAGMAYALWLLPLVRLAMPPLVLPAWLAPTATPVPVAQARVGEIVTLTLAEPAAPVLTLPWELLLSAAWLGGAALFLLARVIEYREMRARLLAHAVGVDRREGVRIVETPAVYAPVAFGVRDKVIAVPPRFLISGALQERELAIAHELAHHRGRDLLANMLAQGVLALHWFNPLAWAAWSAMRRDQEAACDARAMAGRDSPTRAAYAKVIASFAVGERLNTRAALAAPMACPVLGDKSIVHRLRSLTMSDISPRRRRVARWLLGAGAALALPLTATVVYAGPEDVDAEVEVEVAASTPDQPVERTEKRYVIINAPDGASPDDASLHRRTVVRDGKTIVIKTRAPLSEAQAEAKIAEAEASLRQSEAMLWAERIGKPPAPPQTPEPPEAPAAPGHQREVRKIVIHDDAGRTMQEGMGTFLADCGGAPRLVNVQASHHEGAETARKVAHARVVLCAKPGQAHSLALAAIRQARASIASDGSMSGSVRAMVLDELDRSIADMEREPD